jgi:hypothetical protein
MKRSKMILMLLAAFVVATFSVAQADTILLVTAPQTGAWTVDWSQLGAAGATIPHIFTAQGNDPLGDYVTGLFSGGNSNKGIVGVQGTNWSGNFNTGDYLVWTNNHGPLTLGFLSNEYNFVGAYFQQKTYGAFTAKLELYDGPTLLGSVTEHGVSNNLHNGSAIFIGALDVTGSNITRVVFSETAGSGTANFAIGDLYYYTPVPEPGTMVLLGSGLIGLAGFARRRFSK